jgi:outer membrane lipoprotein LolB
MSYAASPTEDAHPLRQAALGLLILLVLGGCVTTQGDMAKKAGTAEERRAALLALTDWQVEGRIALSAGREAWSGTFSWKQVHDDLDFRFRGPLGLGGFRIYGDLDRLRVKTTTGEQFSLTDPETELREKFGWSIPVHSMRYWMLTLPDPEGEAAETTNGARELVLLEQLGWTVAYDGYTPTEGRSMPRKITMDGDGVRIRVVAERWDFDE